MVVSFGVVCCLLCGVFGYRLLCVFGVSLRAKCFSLTVVCCLLCMRFFSVLVECVMRVVYGVLCWCSLWFVLFVFFVC